METLLSNRTSYVINTRMLLAAKTTKKNDRKWKEEDVTEQIRR